MTESFYRLSVDQYHEMIRAGILKADDPVELLDGWLVQKMPKSPIHSLVTLKARRAFDRMLPDGFYASSLDPVTAGDSEPEPDVIVVRGDPDQFRDQHPGPEFLVIVMEVAISSFGRDRAGKKQIHARFQIPEYWIINLLDRRIEVYTDPSGPAEIPDYRQRQDFNSEAVIAVRIVGQEVGHLRVMDVMP